ncbi:mucin-5AC-like [Rhagoletis pomonella]|uniref:mucin-5AC-like n=1 Tax=Rhagoletis pomonella TaxID=28610 RepID=UPI0017841584|nr:mucin-5AC-like [Rhagoletis pomonella]
MSQVPTNNKTNNKCSKVADKKYNKCLQLSAQRITKRIMGSNTSRHSTSTGMSTLDNASNMTMAAETATCRVLSTTVKNALRPRHKCARGTHRIKNSHSTQKPTAVFKLTTAPSGSASTETQISAHPASTSLYDVSGVSADATVCCNPSDEAVGVDDVDKSTIACDTSRCSDAAKDARSIGESGRSTSASSSVQKLSGSHATRASVATSRRTKAVGNIKITTTTRRPYTHTTTTTTASTETQLTKAKKITASNTTISIHAPTSTSTAAAAASAITANERVRKAAIAEEAAAAYSAATRLTQSAIRLTSANFTPIVTAAQVAGASTAVNVKSKFSENKCPLAVLTNVSNQRKVEANSTVPALKQYTLSGNNVNSSHEKSTCVSSRTSEELNKKWPEELSSADTECETSRTARIDAGSNSNKDITRKQNLAARKAKLKSEFFRDFESRGQVNKRLAQPSALINICSVDLPKRFSDSGQSNLLQSQVNAGVTRSTSPLTTAALLLPQISVNTADTTSPVSLVTRRKLDLKRKFEQQSSPRASPHCHQLVLIGASSAFPRVEELVQKFDSQPPSPARKMIVNPNNSIEAADSNMLSLKPDVLEQRNSPLSDEGCNLGQSPYSSDNEDNESTNTTSTAVLQSKHKDKVARSASSDSALGLDVDESMDTTPAQPPTCPQQRRMTLTVTDLPLRPALLPLAEPTALPDSPTIDLQQTVNILPAQTTVPSKVLLEERVVELPEDPRSLAPSQPCSRRESAQSCGSDYASTEFPGGRRFVRTPSVVVSDYSDDVMCGITLEEIEYFRAQRMQRRHSSLDTANEGEGESDVSAASSCSNLYYCGSTISALDGAECYVNGVRTSLDRKTSDCSTCSVSADEESFTIPEDPQQQTGTSKDLADLLAAQHLSAKPAAKKVGLVVPLSENLGEKFTY